MMLSGEERLRRWMFLGVVVLYCVVTSLDAQTLTLPRHSGFGFSGGRGGWGTQTNQNQGTFQGRSNQRNSLQSHTMQQTPNTQQTINQARPWHSQFQNQGQNTFNGNTNNFRTNAQPSQTQSQGNFHGNMNNFRTNAQQNLPQSQNTFNGNTNTFRTNAQPSQTQSKNAFRGNTNNFRMNTQPNANQNEQALPQTRQQGTPWRGNTGQTQLRQVDIGSRQSPSRSWQTGVNTRGSTHQQPTSQRQSDTSPRLHNNWDNIQTPNTDFNSRGNTIQFNNNQQGQHNIGHTQSLSSQQQMRRMPTETGNMNHRLQRPTQFGQRQQKFISNGVQASNQNHFNSASSPNSVVPTHNQVRNTNNVLATDSNSDNMFFGQQRGAVVSSNNQIGTQHGHVPGRDSNTRRNVAQGQARHTAFSSQTAQNIPQNVQTNVNSGFRVDTLPPQSVQRRHQGFKQTDAHSFPNMQIEHQSQHRNIGSNQGARNSVNVRPSRKTVQAQHSGTIRQHDVNNVMVQRKNPSQLSLKQNRGIGFNQDSINERQPQTNLNQFSDRIIPANNVRNGQKTFTHQGQHHTNRVSSQFGALNAPRESFQSQQGTREVLNGNSQTSTQSLSHSRMSQRQRTRHVPQNTANRNQAVRRENQQATFNNRGTMLHGPNTRDNQHRRGFQRASQTSIDVSRNVPQQNRLSNSLNQNAVMTHSDNRLRSVNQPIAIATKSSGQSVQTLLQGVLPRQHDTLSVLRQPNTNNHQVLPSQNQHFGAIPNGQTDIQTQHVRANDQRGRQTHFHTSHINANNQQVSHTHGKAQHAIPNVHRELQTHGNDQNIVTSNQHQIQAHVPSLNSATNTQHVLHLPAHTAQSNDHHHLHSHVNTQHSTGNDQPRIHTHSQTAQATQNAQQWLQTNEQALGSHVHDPPGLQTHVPSSHSPTNTQHIIHTHDPALHQITNNHHRLQTNIHNSHATVNDQHRTLAQTEVLQSPIIGQQGVQTHVHDKQLSENDHMRPHGLAHDLAVNSHNGQHGHTPGLTANNQNGHVTHQTLNHAANSAAAASAAPEVPAAISPLSPEGIAQILAELGVNVKTPTSQTIPQPVSNSGGIQAHSHVQSQSVSSVPPGNAFGMHQPSNMHNVPRWDGSSVNVPHHIAMQGFTHGSQFSPFMQQMWFGDTIDPPDPPDPTPKPGNGSKAKPGTHIEMEGVVTSTNIAPDTTTFSVSTINTPKDTPGPKIPTINDQSVVQNPQSPNIVMEIAQSLALLLGRKETTTRKQDVVPISTGGNNGGSQIDPKMRNNVPNMHDGPQQYTNQDIQHATPQIGPQFRQTVLVAKDTPNVRDAPNIIHALPHNGPVSSQITNEGNQVRINPNVLHEHPQSGPDTRHIEFIGHERRHGHINPNRDHVRQPAKSSMGHIAPIAVDRPLNPSNPNILPPTDPHIHHLAPRPLIHEHVGHINMPRVDTSERKSRITAAELPLPHVHNNAAPGEFSDLKTSHSQTIESNAVVMAPTASIHTPSELNNNIPATIGRHSDVAKAQDHSNLKVMDLMEKIRHLLGSSLLVTTTPKTRIKTTTMRTTTTTKYKPTTQIPKQSSNGNHHECNYRSPHFQCRGKELFATLESTAAWCVAMCIRKKCVKAVCECNCNKDTAPFMLPKKKGGYLNGKGAVMKPGTLNKQLKKQGLRRAQKTLQQSKINKGLRGKAHNQRHQRRHRRPGQRKQKPAKQKKVVASKPLPTTVEPPEIEAEDMISTTAIPIPTTTFATETTWTIPTVDWFVSTPTAMPVYRERVVTTPLPMPAYRDRFGTTPTPIPAYKDITLRPVRKRENQNAHVTVMPQLLWASELRSRLRLLAKTAMKKTTVPPRISFLGIAITTPSVLYAVKANRNVNKPPELNVRHNRHGNVNNANGSFRNMNKPVRHSADRNSPPRITQGRGKSRGSAKRRFKHPAYVIQQPIPKQRPADQRPANQRPADQRPANQRTEPPITVRWNPQNVDVIPTEVPTNHWNEAVTTENTPADWVNQQWGQTTTHKPSKQWAQPQSEAQWRNQPSTERPQWARQPADRQWREHKVTEKPHTQWAGHQSENQWQGSASQAPPTAPPNHSWREPARGPWKEQPPARAVSDNVQTNHAPRDQWQNTVSKSNSKPRDHWQDNQPTAAPPNNWPNPSPRDRQTDQWRDPAPTPTPRDPWHDSAPASRDHRHNPHTAQSRGPHSESKPDAWRDSQPAPRSHDQWRDRSPTAPPRRAWHDPHQQTGRPNDRWSYPQPTQRSASAWDTGRGESRPQPTQRSANAWDTGRGASRPRSAPAPRWGGGSRDTWRQPVSGRKRGSWGEPPQPPLSESGSRDTWRAGSSWHDRSTGGAGSSWHDRSTGGAGSYYRPRRWNTTRKPKRGGEQEPPEAPDK